MFSVFILQHSLEIADTPPKPMAPIISQAEFDDMPIPAAASRSAASSRNFGSGLQHPPEQDVELPPESFQKSMGSNEPIEPTIMRALRR